MDLPTRLIDYSSVKLIQEWLCLRSYNVSIDNVYGPATQRALVTFLKDYNLTTQKLEIDVDHDAPSLMDYSDLMSEDKFRVLAEPMYNALMWRYIDLTDPPYSVILEVARQHLEVHPVEVGGQNMGPWVRLYMHGSEGYSYPWCAGFVSFILQQCEEDYGITRPMNYSWSTTEMGTEAIQKGISYSHERTDMIRPGHMFLVRKGISAYQHVGFVTDVYSDSFATIEGNTNDEGSREGYEVCARTRALSDKYHFICY